MLPPSNAVVGLRMETVFSQDPELQLRSQEALGDADETLEREYINNKLIRDPIGNEIVGLSFSCSENLEIFGIPKSFHNIGLFLGRDTPDGKSISHEKMLLEQAWGALSWLFNACPTIVFTAPAIQPHLWRFLLCRSQKYGLQIPMWASDGLTASRPWNYNQHLVCPLDAFRNGAKDMADATMLRLALFLGLKDEIPAVPIKEMARSVKEIPVGEVAVKASQQWATIHRKCLEILESTIMRPIY
jgi:hypothetical protein